MVTIESDGAISGEIDPYNRFGIIPTETGTITISSMAKASSSINIVMVDDNGEISSVSKTSSATVNIPEGTVAVFIDRFNA